MTISAPQYSVQKLSPYSAQVLDTLKNIIAPGKRFRISPHIEATQFFCLFGEIFDPAARNQHMYEIFRQHDARLEELAKKHSQFVSGPKVFKGSYDKAFLDCYMIYYFPVNVAKLQLILLELLEREKLDTEIRIIDIGVGSGTSAIALFDYLLAWATVCNLYDVDFPISSVKYTGIDNNSFCLEYAEQAVKAFAEEVKRRGDATGNKLHNRVVEWLGHCEWVQEELNTGYKQVVRENHQTIVIVSNVLNELEPQGKKGVEDLFISLPDGSLGLFIEPGDKKKTTELNTWRKNIQINNKVYAVAPCGQEQKNISQYKCDSCWNARRESLFQSPLYTAFREKCSRYSKDRRTNSFDEYQNNLLSWSYYILKTGRDAIKDSPEDLASGNLKRYVGSFAKSVPVAPSHGESCITAVDEYLKFCPGTNLKYKTMVICRKPGMQCPELRHGENVNLNSVETAPQHVWEKAEALQLSPEEPAMFDIVPVGRRRNENAFLISYTSQVKSAVDDIAFRLFGFPAMRPFQHGILEKVLQGGNILGIAATGGGKSECYILPAMLLPGITIVIAPLISLIQDQFEQRIRDRYGLEGVATYINSDVPFKERQARLKRLTLGYYKIIYLTPEQLEKSYILNCLQEADRKHTIRYLALDESHCISQWGHDFRPAYLNMVSRLKLWEIRPTRIALTATASPEVRQDLCQELDLNPEPLESGGDVYLHSSNRPELNFIARAFPNMKEKSDAMVDALKQLKLQNKRPGNKGAAIIFFPYTGGNPEFARKYLPDSNAMKMSQKGMLSAGVTPFASYLERKLCQRVSIYHGKIENNKADNSAQLNKRMLGDLRGRTRQSQQIAFICGNTDLMVATKGFGMGIDKPNIRLVIHRTPTSNLEAYVQEAGRAGRDGELANCLLFYSPDAQDEDQGNGRSLRVPSDHEIQTRFLSDKYIRMQDMVVMFHFLRSVERKFGDYIYFTNDEALDFFQRCIKHRERLGLSGYDWPKFPKREKELTENEEENLILERGYYYQEKTRYLDRILSVAYRIRPKINEKRVSFLEELQETGASFSAKKVQLIDASSIVESNSYFGEFIRAKGLDDKGLDYWLKQCASGDFIKFTQSLGISLKETANLFQDIKRADGYFDRNGEWRPRLLDFGAIIPPKYGPAQGQNTLPQWRNYAGAKYRNKKAYIEAKKKNRKATIDEVFPWNSMPFSKGWEVKLGSAFDSVNNFETFLKAFMQVHDEREKNDWAAYYRLLSDYIGVDKEGQIRKNDDRKCLRSVMLGYLKTYEVVEGGSCLSCNVCVPNEKFETDLEMRKQVVVRLSKAIADLIEHWESAWDLLPEEKAIQSLWKLVQVEVAAGRSALGYIEGTTSRMLDDNPAHIPALYIRLTGMVKSIMAMDEQAFVDNAHTLVSKCSKGDTECFCNTFLHKAHDVLPENANLHDVHAIALNKLGKYRDEYDVRTRIRTMQGTSKDLYEKNCQFLCDLTEPGGPLENQEIHVKYSLELARGALHVKTSRRYYLTLLKEWSWERMVEELEWQRECGTRPKTQLFLLEKWLSEFNGVEDYEKVYAYIEDESLVNGWPDIWQTKLFSDRPVASFERYPLLKHNYWKAVEIYDFKPVPQLYSVIFSDFVRRNDTDFTNKSLKVISDILFVIYDEVERHNFLEENISKDTLFPKKLIRYLSTELLPRGISYFKGWLTLFEKYIDRNDFTTTYSVIAKLFKHTEKQVNELLDQYTDFFVNITLLLLSDDGYAEKTHKLWFEFCKKNPDAFNILTCYFQCILVANPSKRELLKDVCEWIVDNDLAANAPFLSTLESSLPEGIEIPNATLTNLLEFRVLIRTLKRNIEIDQHEALTYEHFKAISTVFKPEINVHHADMMVELLTALRRHLVQSWLTPVSYLVEALGYARRFEEAEKLVANYSDLKVGRPKVIADTFLRKLIDKSSELRKKPQGMELITRLAGDEVRNWKIAKPRRRW